MAKLLLNRYEIVNSLGSEVIRGNVIGPGSANAIPAVGGGEKAEAG